MIRVGLVGAGPWAEQFTAPMLASSPELTLAGVWARRRPAAEALAHRYGVGAVETFEDLLDACDAVAFCVPPDVQAPLAVTAARAGKHLLLEKPVAFTVADAEAVAAAADAAGVATQLMLTYRFTDQVRAFVGATAGTRVGYVRIAFVVGGALPGSPFATPWRQAPRAALPDLGPHTLDLAEAVAGPIVELRAAEAVGVVSVTSRHAGGATGHIALSVTTPGPFRPMEAESASRAGRASLADLPRDLPAAVRHAITDAFARAVRGEARQPLDAHHGVHLQRLVAAVATSIDTATTVTVTGPRPWGSADTPSP